MRLRHILLRHVVGGASSPTHCYQHDTICFSMDDIAHITCMDEFYKAVDMMVYLRDRHVQDIQQIWMNEEQCEVINALCKKNAKKSKKYKHLNTREIESAVAMDWLCYSPVSVPYVPENEIWIWSTENYHTAMDEYRAWRNDNPRKDI